MSQAAPMLKFSVEGAHRASRLPVLVSCPGQQWKCRQTGGSRQGGGRGYQPLEQGFSQYRRHLGPDHSLALQGLCHAL